MTRPAEEAVMFEAALKTLGFPELDIEGRAAKLTLRKAVALLIYLAEANGPVAREVAATLLWPETDPETARARLRRMLHRIETTLGRTILEAGRTSIRWSPAVRLCVDSHLFESACSREDFEEACRLYRGDFLAGFSLPDCPEFEDWAFYRREALRGRLMHALERLVRRKKEEGEHLAAAAFASRLAGLDPYSEVYCRYLIRSLLLAGDRSAAKRHYSLFEQRLRDELGVAPEAKTQALMGAGTGAADPEATRYARGAGIHLAFQVHGSGALDIVVMPGFVSSVERFWELPACRAFLGSLMTIGRLILFDPRGIGLSDRVGSPPGLDATVEDIDTVLRAAQSRRVILFGASQCGGACIKFAAQYPERVAGLILFGVLAKGCWAPDHPFALRAAQFDAWRERLIAGWGGPIGIETFGPSLSGDAQSRAWWAGLLRSASSPGALKAVLDGVRDVDVRPLLPLISVPALVLHRRLDRAVRIEAGRYVASHIKGARFVELKGGDHWFFAGDQEPVIEAIRRFVAEFGHGLGSVPSGCTSHDIAGT
jgi:DNA-binding SARP family transcriptional activator/pimeloyl-ACP methyl ester carboxylesterase